jgi:CubicO group peptidase (beta-lactamase class C family)
MVYFSGIHVGASPAVVSQGRVESSRLSEVVTQHVEREFGHHGHIGLVVGAIAKDEEILLRFGARQLGVSQPPDADTVFEIGSMSKVFTGILLAERIENGELELDDRIAELLERPETGYPRQIVIHGRVLRGCGKHGVHPLESLIQ